MKRILKQTLKLLVGTFDWRTYAGNMAYGTKVEGDKGVPPTTKWNHLLLLLFVWNRVAIFRVDPKDALWGYYIGYIPQSGMAEIRKEASRSVTFCVRTGYEDCTFFAVNIAGEEVPLTLVGYATTQDSVRAGPLY